MLMQTLEYHQGHWSILIQWKTKVPLCYQVDYQQIGVHWVCPFECWLPTAVLQQVIMHWEGNRTDEYSHVWLFQWEQMQLRQTLSPLFIFVASCLYTMTCSSFPASRRVQWLLFVVRLSEILLQLSCLLQDSDSWLCRYWWSRLITWLCVSVFCWLYSNDSGGTLTQLQLHCHQHCQQGSPCTFSPLYRKWLSLHLPSTFTYTCICMYSLFNWPFIKVVGTN